MVRFQLVFQTADGERSEIRDSNTAGEPHIDGKVIVDGGTYAIRNVEWSFRREDVGEITRFVCTPVVEPESSIGELIEFERPAFEGI